MIPKLNERQKELLYFFNSLSRQRDHVGGHHLTPMALKRHEIRAELPYTSYNDTWFVWCIEQIDAEWLSKRYEQIRRRSNGR